MLKWYAGKFCILPPATGYFYLGPFYFIVFTTRPKSESKNKELIIILRLLLMGRQAETFGHEELGPPPPDPLLKGSALCFWIFYFDRHINKVFRLSDGRVVGHSIFLDFLCFVLDLAPSEVFTTKWLSRIFFRNFLPFTVI